jgi:transporter family-2 protein
MDILFVPLSVMAGALLPVQAGANAQLAKSMKSPIAATTLQLAVAALLLLILSVLSGSLWTLSLRPDAPWWHWIGGMASAFYVISGILLFPRIGAVVSVGLFIAGQVLASAALDVFGLLGVKTIGLSLGIAVGAILVMAGTALVVLGQQGARGEARSAQLGWIALGLVAGALLPIQGAVNALLRVDLSGATLAVSTISFAVATMAMVVVQAGATGLLRAAARPSLDGLSSVPWWGWLGGFVGATYVTTVFTAMPAIGAAATVGLTIAGQQVASIFVDRYGLLRLPQRHISTTRLIGVALLLAGVGVIKLI